MNIQRVSISTDFITLDAFLKWVGVAGTGGHAKTLISSGVVLVNGDVEMRRGRKVRPGDQIEIHGTEKWEVTKGEEG